MRAGPVFSSEAGVQRCLGAMVWEESQKFHGWGAGHSLRSLGALAMGTCLGGLGAGREEPGSRGRQTGKCGGSLEKGQWEPVRISSFCPLVVDTASRKCVGARGKSWAGGKVPGTGDMVLFSPKRHL